MKIKFETVLPLFFCFLSLTGLFGQTIKTLPSGETVMVYPDGSWRKYQKNSEDSSRVDELAAVSNPIPNPPPSPEFIYTQADVPALETKVIKAINSYREKVNYKYDRQDNLENIRSKPNVTDDELLTATKDLEVAIQAEEVALQTLENSKAELKKAKVTPPTKAQRKSKDNNETSETFPSQEGGVVDTSAQNTANEEITFNQVSIEDTSPKKKTVGKSSCGIQYKGIDEFSKKKRIELNPDLFFTYSNKEIKQILKEQDVIRCEGYMAAISGGYRYLLLTFSFPSQEIRRDYGTYREGSFLQIKFIDDEKMTLYNTGVDDVRFNSKTGLYDIQAQFSIDYKQEKILRKKDIDKIRVTWTSGFEDYEVFNTQFLKNQIQCLEKELD